MVLHKIKDIQNFNTMYTSNCSLLTIYFMTKETYQNFTKFILMKIHKYTNILKMISLNYNPRVFIFQNHGGVRFYARTCNPWFLLLWTHPLILTNDYMFQQYKNKENIQSLCHKAITIITSYWQHCLCMCH